MNSSSILNLIKQSATNETTLKYCENIFCFYEQLQYATNIKQIAEDIFTWLNKEFNINNLIFSLFDLSKSTKEDILTMGEKFYLDDDLSHFFIVTTYTNLNATIAFCATSVEHSKILEDKYEIIEAAFSLISPIIQNGILRKNFVDSLSIDSVMNIYSKDYLIDKLTERIKHLENKKNEIYLLMIEIDRFKNIIDEVDDHEVADKVLIELAKVIYSNINEFDMVGRLNKDMFLVSLDDCDEVKAHNIAKKIIQDFSEVTILVDKKTKKTLNKTICIGFDKYQPESQNSLDESIEHANIALYEAKNLGNNSFCKFSDL